MKSVRYLLASWFVVANALADEGLGPLFYTPEQRMEIDRQRQSASPADTFPDQAVRLDGVVRNSRGRHTLWINGHPQSSVPDSRERMASRRGTPAESRIDTEAGPVRLRVGEAVNLSSGKRYRNVDDGAIRIHKTHEP